MRSTLDVRLGAELPQIVHEPPEVASRQTARDTIELANRYQISDGFPLSPSQELRLLNGMAERSDGSWAAKRVGDFGGRQGAGKSATAIARIFGGIFLVGEQLIIYTAHEYPTANEIYIRIGQILESWDDFSGLVTHERKSHGDQGYDLKGPKGSEITGKRRLLFKTRTGKSGRGFAKADLILYDEAQHLHPEHIAGSGPAKLANPNSQSWWSGSGGLATSGPAWKMRREALLGTGGRLSYTEHTAETWQVQPDGRIVWTSPNPEDRDAWYAANPGLGRWVAEEDFADLMLELSDLAPRELLCVWEPESGDVNGPIDPSRWALLADKVSMATDDTIRLCLDAPPELTSATFSIAGIRTDGLLHGSVRHHVPAAKLTELVATAKALCDGHGVDLILPPNSPAKAWKPDLLAAGVPLDEMTGPEYAEACGNIKVKVAEGGIRHRGQPDLAGAIEGLAVHRSGDLEVWARRSSKSNIAPFVALTCALHRVPVPSGESAFVSLILGG